MRPTALAGNALHLACSLSGHLLPVSLLAAALISGCGDNVPVPSHEPPGDPPFTPGLIAPFPALACPGAPSCPSADGILHVGAARGDITPDLSAYETEWTDTVANNHHDSGEPFVDRNGNGRFDVVWLAGFQSGRPATGVHDPISVRAIVFDRGDTRVGLAVLDAVGFFASDMDAARELLDPGLELDHVIIASTHVHETPDTIGLWGRNQFETGIDLDYQALVKQRIAETLASAVDNLQPVTMSVARTLTVDESGSARPYVGDSRDPVAIDPTMTIARFDAPATADAPGHTVATLVHWASHPEYFWRNNNLITADFVYWVRDIVENGAAETPARGLPALDGIGGEVIYLNGAIGGLIGPGSSRPIGPDGQPVSDNGMAKAEAVGTNLGRLALETITRADEVSDVAAPTLEMRTGLLHVTVENQLYQLAHLIGLFDRAFVGFDPDAPIGLQNLPYLESRVSYLRVGPVAIATAPGELFPEIFLGGYDGSQSHGYELVDPDNPLPPLLDLAAPPPYLRDLMLGDDRVEFPLIAGLAEDFLGYIIPTYDFVVHDQHPYIREAEGDHYEETNSIGPKAEDEIVSAMKAIIKGQP